MKKKAKEKKTEEKIVPEKPKQMPQNDERSGDVKTGRDDDEKPFDFGGIPDRDLKKNLGCG